MHVVCNETQINCKNGFCKPRFWQCDGVNDCGDNTDEENCGKNETSTQSHEQWSKSKGIDFRLFCFFSILSAGNCKAEEFRCRTGRCIPTQKQCNGYNDCGDGSDESQCEKCENFHSIMIMTLPVVT